MKNISRIIATLAIGLIALSCEKENSDSALATTNDQVSIDESKIIDKQKYPGISVENGVLCFESIEFYESIVSDESKSYGTDKLIDYLNTTQFKSYGKKFGDESEYDEPFMDAIMNEAKVVKIGEWFIYIDAVSETVLTISANEQDAYQSLINESSETIKKFSVEDDVLDHLANNTDPQDRSCGGIGGDDFISTKVYVVGSTWYESEMHFNRFGIYFVLKGGFDSNDLAGLGSGIELQFLAPELWCEKRPCGAGDVKTRNTAPISYSGVHQADFKFYENVKNLNGYYFYCRTKVTYASVNYYTNYVGNSVNY